MHPQPTITDPPLNCSMGFARLAEDTIRRVRGKGEKEPLGALDKIVASTVGGALATWNQPIEVIRVEVRAMHIHTCPRFDC